MCGWGRDGYPAHRLAGKRIVEEGQGGQAKEGQEVKEGRGRRRLVSYTSLVAHTSHFDLVQNLELTGCFNPPYSALRSIHLRRCSQSQSLDELLCVKTGAPTAAVLN